MVTSEFSWLHFIMESNLNKYTHIPAKTSIAGWKMGLLQKW